MWLEILKTFLDGPVKFYAGEVRCVDDENVALRAIGRSWARKVDAPAVKEQATKPAAPVTLEVQKSTLGMKERKHG